MYILLYVEFCPTFKEGKPNVRNMYKFLSEFLLLFVLRKDGTTSYSSNHLNWF